eukprot:g2516.t1
MMMMRRVILRSRCAVASNRGVSSVVDLRSDTVTRPCEEMRDAMRSANVGDDVFGDDPTVTELEERVANLLGKERALFVPSGTMSNLVGIAAHSKRGDEIILGDKSHIHLYEAGGVSVLMSVTQRTVPNFPDGSIRVSDVESAIRVDDPHYPRTSIVTLENTQNACGGIALPQENIDEIGALCENRELIFHIDGARIFNAVEASGTPVDRMVSSAHSVSVCLSKGLGAPAGSVLVGKRDFIARARRVRKMVGGGMRQAGILCAAGLYAIENNVSRIKNDHERARKLAETIGRLDEIDVDVSKIQTNMVYFSVREESDVDIDTLVDALKDEGVLVGSGYSGGKGFRAVTHLGISDADADYAGLAMERAVRASRVPRGASLG